MENIINISSELNSQLAVNEEKASNLWNTLLERYKNSQSELIIDFSGMRVIISPFMRSLLKPLYNSWVDFEGKNFNDERSQNIYNRVIEEFNKIWTESIREISI